ncbi:COG5454 Predicted secreted protein [Rhabdaerophilaceae bacterium]
MAEFREKLHAISGPAAVLVGLCSALAGLLLVLFVLYFRSGSLIFSVGTSIAIYFVIWWISIFAVLPFGVRSQLEAGAVSAGSDPGAPARANLLWYVIVNSAVASLVSLVFLVWIAPLI